MKASHTQKPDQKRVNVCEHKAPSLPHVYIHLLSSDQERHLWSSKYFDQVSVCLWVTFVWRSLSFFGKSFSFLFLFVEIIYSYDFRNIFTFFVSVVSLVTSTMVKTQPSTISEGPRMYEWSHDSSVLPTGHDKISY